MNILINGLGNIGTTLLHLLNRYKGPFQIQRIYALKNIPKPWEEHVYERIKDLGIQLIYENELDALKKEIHFIFDATANGIGLKNKEMYRKFPHLIAAVAQGSEGDFGLPYMGGINDSLVAKERFFSVVSCNTHGMVSLLKYFTNNDFQRLHRGDFVIVRRSEDMGNHERLVSGNVVARHRTEMGTHHGADCVRLLNTIGINPRVFSSDITTPSQFMHGIRFNLQLHDTPVMENGADCLVSSTEYFDSNRIFELGRRFGYLGRWYSHSILVRNNMVQGDHSILGWAFVPQEGNTLLSTLKLFLLKTMGSDINTIYELLRKDLFVEKI